MSSWRIELVSCSYRCFSSLPCLLSRHPPRGRGSSNEENQGGGGFTQRRRPDAERQWEGGRRLGLSVIEVRGICVGVTIYIIPRFLPHTYPHDHSRLPATLCHGPCILFWPKGISSATTGCFASSSRSNAHSWLSTRRGRSRYRRSGRGESSLEIGCTPVHLRFRLGHSSSSRVQFQQLQLRLSAKEPHDLRGGQPATVFHGGRSRESVLHPYPERRSVDQLWRSQHRSRQLPRSCLDAHFRQQQSCELSIETMNPPPALTVFHYFS